MGWDNPPIPWSELERKLSDRSRPRFAERQTLVPWGDRPVPARPPDLPWPGSLPELAPSTVCPAPPPALVLAADGRQVSVSARGVLSGEPALFQFGEPGELRPV